MSKDGSSPRRSAAPFTDEARRLFKASLQTRFPPTEGDEFTPLLKAIDKAVEKAARKR